MNSTYFWTTTGKVSSELFACMVLFFLLSAVAIAQVTASISGTVQDATGAVIPNATVTVKSVETGSTREVRADEAGRYRALSLPVGRYEIKAEQAGFQPQTKSGINLTIGQEAVVSFTLEPGVVTQEVTVTAAAEVVNTTTTSISGLVGEREVKDLPLNGRSFDNLITLNPGTVNFTTQRGGGGLVGTGNVFSIAGRRFAENEFLLNGVEYTGSGLFANTPGGVSGQLLGIDAIREFNVVKDTYAAEYGKRAGGQIAIVTMSGGNQIHGSAFEFLRNDVLDARNFFDQRTAANPKRIPPFRRNNFGGSAGGPILKDRSFVFGNYEGFRQRLGLSNLAIVPDANARQGFLPDPANPGQLLNVGVAPGVAPFFALWPLPNGRNFGDGTAESFSNPNQKIREDFGTARGDHTFSEADSLNGVYTIDDGESVTPTTNPLTVNLIDQRTQVASLQETHVFSSNLINSLTFGFSRANFFFTTGTMIDFPSNLTFVKERPIGQVRIGGGSGSAATSVTTGGAGNPSTDTAEVRNLFTVANNLQWTKGIHLISAGVWFQRVQVNDGRRKDGQVVFPTLTDFLEGKPSGLFQTVPSPTELGWRSLEGAWYLQDTVKLKPNLTVTLGLRHEFTNGWNEVAGRAANFFPGPDGVLLTEPRSSDSVFTTNNAKKLFAPRVGLAWDPFGTGKTSIHAGLGLYYSLLDDLGFCCDTTPPFNTLIVLRNPAFPIQIIPGAPLPAAQFGPNGIKPDIKTPSVARWSFKLEQALSASMAVSAAYIGSRGYHGTAALDLNTVIPQILPDGTKFFPAGAPRRNPLLDNTSTFEDAADSYYHALELEWTRRFSRGLQFRANYTFAKSMDNSSSVISNQALNSPQNVLDPEDPARDRSRSAFDIRHRFSVNGSYELPIGRGKPIFGQASGAVDKLVSGWQLNAILNAQSGLSFTPTLGFNRSRNGDSRAPDRPSFAPGITRVREFASRTPERFFDPTLFVLPAAGAFGNTGRNILVGPKQTSFDLSVFKATRISERFNLQFRFEAFNLPNHTDFSLPQSVVLNPNGTVPGSAGRITSTATSSRQLQFGLKLIW